MSRWTIPASQALRERLAPVEGHDEVRAAVVQHAGREQADEARVVDAQHAARFVDEAAALALGERQVGAQDLQRDGRTRGGQGGARRGPRLHDDAAAPLPQDADDVEARHGLRR
jgi:hypothetical protein